MKQGLGLALSGLILLSVGLAVQADPPTEIDYQGKILVNDIPLTGPGYFKYAIGNEAGATNFWAHDGTPTGEPATWLTNACYNGVFSAALGAAPMGNIHPTIFAIDTSLYLRVWFSGDAVAFNEMLPAQRFLSAPYAINADTLDGYHAIDLLGGSITETDPVFGASPAFGISAATLATWNAAYGWGDHADKGYLTNTAYGTAAINAYRGDWGEAVSNLAANAALKVEMAEYLPLAGGTMTGRLGISSTNPSAPVQLGNYSWPGLSGSDNQIVVSRWVTNDGVHVNAHAFVDSSGITRNGNIGYCSFDVVTTVGGENNFSHINAFQDRRVYGSTGYLDWSCGYWSKFSIVNGSVGRNYGIYIDTPSLQHVGTMKTNIGIYVAPLTNATEKNYAIYTEGDSVSRFGSIEIGGESRTNWPKEMSAEAVGQIATNVVAALPTDTWNAAYGWGDHAAAGYLTSYTETDPIWTAASILYYQATEADNHFVDVTGDTMIGALAIDDLVSGTLKLDSSLPNMALGAKASAMGGIERIAIGHNVTNDLDNTARIRGALYLDDGMAIFGREPFATGAFQQLLPLPPLDNVVYVATNGTSTGPGSVDRPFDTPQDAYNYVAFNYPNRPAAVVIAAGRYSGLNMNAGHIHVIGASRAQLESLNVTAGRKSIVGKQRVENLIVTGNTVVDSAQGKDVKFHNCRFEEGLMIYGSHVEVQDCFAAGGGGAAVMVGNGTANSMNVSLEQSSFISSGQATLEVNQYVNNFQVIGCQIVNEGAGPCIVDREPGPIGPSHLYTHNYLKGAVEDPSVGPFGRTIAFTQNTVLGDVGLDGHAQFYANNIVYGLINNVGGPGPGWIQAGSGTGIDAAGNTEHETDFPQLPASWLD